MRKYKRMAALSTMAVMLCGCSMGAKSSYITMAELSKEEENLIKLCGKEDTQNIYDIKLGKETMNMKVTAYELIDGEWSEFWNMDSVKVKKEGRMAIEAEETLEQIRVSIQDKDGVFSVQREDEEEEARNGAERGKACAELTEEQEIEEGKEIPVMVQCIVGESPQIRGYGTESFFTPEVFAKEKYSHVYAVTVRFESADSSSE